MIRFKEFDVGDIDYEEQIEQFQKEYPSAEFVQITGGYTSYEKIWFKYEDGIEQPKLNKNQEQVLGWLKVDYCKKDSLFEALERIGEVYEDPKTEEAFYSLSRVEEAEVIQMFIEWFLEQEEAE